MKISEFYQILGAVEEYKLGKLSDLTTDDGMKKHKLMAEVATNG